MPPVADAASSQASAARRPATPSGTPAKRPTQAPMRFPIGAFLSQPLRADVVVGYHEAIAAATDLPLILFQLQPALAGVLYPPSILARLLAIPAVTAIKEASFDPVRFVEMRAAIAESGRSIT